MLSFKASDLFPGRYPSNLYVGLWSVGTSADMDEVCRVFNLDKEIVERYIQFGGVFNLLHAAASYLRIHQRGFGAVGVSGKYGRRSKQRYPIFWGLPKIGSLPNPDPADIAEMDKTKRTETGPVVDDAMEANRGELRRRAQQWAGLTVDEKVSLDLDFVAITLLLPCPEFPRSGPSGLVQSLGSHLPGGPCFRLRLK